MGNERLKNPKHPTQKPIKVLTRLLNLGSKENDLVFDPFMGVGSSGVAALNLKRRFLGFEKEAIYVDAAAKRFVEVCDVKVAPITRNEAPPFLLMESPFGLGRSKKLFPIAA